MCRYSWPVALLMPSSQVRFTDAYSANERPFTSAASTEVADAVSSGCRRPRSPANAQHPQSTGTTASGDRAPAIAVSLPVMPSAVDEQVGCTAIDAIGLVTV